MTTSATKARGVRQGTYDRDKIIRALRRYAELYGPDFTAAAFSPSTAKWRDEPEWIDRYYAGDPDGIGAWPSLNAIKREFEGSFNAAREAAGLPANRPGPSQRPKRAAGEHAPVRDVSHVGATRTVYVEKDSERTQGTLRRLERERDRARARVEVLEERLARRAPAAKTKTTTKTVRVTDDAAVTRARREADRAAASLADARVTVDEFKRDVSEARTSATRAASRAERAEAKVTEIREERRSLAAALKRADDRAAAAERMLAQAEAREAALRAAPTVIEKDAPEQAEIDSAREEARTARLAARESELARATAEREYRELAVAARGDERKLTKAELAELRAGGPSGSAVLAAALREVAKAGPNKTKLGAALLKVASAAIRWRDAL